MVRHYYACGVAHPGCRDDLQHYACCVAHTGCRDDLQPFQVTPPWQGRHRAIATGLTLADCQLPTGIPVLTMTERLGLSGRQELDRASYRGWSKKRSGRTKISQWLAWWPDLEGKQTSCQQTALEAEQTWASVQPPLFPTKATRIRPDQMAQGTAAGPNWLKWLRRFGCDSDGHPSNDSPPRHSRWWTWKGVPYRGWGSAQRRQGVAPSCNYSAVTLPAPDQGITETVRASIWLGNSNMTLFSIVVKTSPILYVQHFPFVCTGTQSQNC